MNLLEDAWMPVRLHDGGREWIGPRQLSDARLAAFDADRPDFNGALAQFAIGLLQTASPVDSVIAWRDLLKLPPDEATLQAWFAPHVGAFELDGDGARFMQDFDLRASDGEPVGIGSLLIEAASGNAIERNSDHFIKRGQVKGLCPHCAALALFTLQVSAPEGGRGNRTGLRGGGPLTTLLVADGEPNAPRSLWHSLWLNVQERHSFEAVGGDPGKSERHFTFPWAASIHGLQRDGGQITPIQVHPAHVFWAMPRRIRLDFDALGAGQCDVCGRESDRRVQRYVARNRGLNYKGPWQHPLSPYYESKEGMLPLHPQPGGLGYRHWMGWVLGMQNDKRKVERAAVVQHFFEAVTQRRAGIGLRLWAFGYDMDGMKARCWYEATVPLYALGDCSPQAQKSLREDVGAWLAGAELAASYLRGAVKDAWFGGDARGDFSFIDASFWGRTEPGFYAMLKERIQAAGEGKVMDGAATGERWLATLHQVAEHLFDVDLVGAGPIERQNPARIAKAHEQLMASLRGPKLRTELKLPVAAKPARKSKQAAVKAA
ncbi:MAG: type CRISPR-associated protein Cse1/CasA [Ramlibacter sp.]|jgi:CRISPR system Cascade subunit CasA|uniref:type I-E CRISPR-associated protein Cse1/CasA n=1 Tax=Ramlibacter sp. TaxID=1917967 RepID=UPI0026055EBC|nr:type I-E CRISPR-associated protein Cse1/CasA [Ramlibacter sp.]MDB5751816.1 type CRISPR-associated protein Cse1/CasA [Ramlibacter sp.]